MIIQKENSSNVLFKKFFFKYDASQAELIIIFQVVFFFIKMIMIIHALVVGSGTQQQKLS